MNTKSDMQSMNQRKRIAGIKINKCDFLLSKKRKIKHILTLFNDFSSLGLPVRYVISIFK